jgi:hypothetical protein
MQPERLFASSAERGQRHESPNLLPKSAADAHVAFAQILGKFYFFDLLEKLRIILLDYGQKRSGSANAAFKPAC